MELHSYAWFIYVLTFMLVMAIFLIFILIGIKCIQTCAYTSVMCFKRRRRRCRRRRNRGSSGSSYCSSDSCSATSSSDSEEEINSRRFGSHPDSQLFHSIHDNLAFAPDLENPALTKNPQVINRKFDDLSRQFVNSSKQPVIKNVTNLRTISDFVDQSFQIHLPVVAAKSQLGENSIVVSEIQLKKEVCSISSCSQESPSLNSTFRVNQLDGEIYNENFSILGNDEIPPPYEQAVKESRV